MENKINLDKICAQYGMELLKFPKILYDKTNELIKISKDEKGFKAKEYNFFDSENNLKEFVEYKLVDPLNEIKKGDKFDKVKDKGISFSPSTFETEITKALGILIEDGPFAFIIWLKSQDKEAHRAILIQTARILKELNLIEINTNEDLKEKIENAFIENISADIKKLLLVKTILEKMLIYARYKAKAMQNK